MSTDPTTTEPETTDHDAVQEDPPARYVVRIAPGEKDPGRFHRRADAVKYAEAYGLAEHAVSDSWASGETMPPWLDQAEAAVDAERAESERIDEAIAVEYARIVNDRLTELGITPITPAGSSGSGNFLPAFLAPSDEGERHYAVHAGFDEEENAVTLLVESYRRPGDREFIGLKLAVDKLTDVRSVLYARRKGPKPTPKPSPQPSLDARSIVDALDHLTDAVESLTRTVSRP